MTCVEEFVGIAGMAESLAEVPDSKFLPPMAMTCQEILFRNRAKENSGVRLLRHVLPISPSRSTDERSATIVGRATRYA